MDSLQFSTWRKVFWPIHSRELPKFLPIAVLMFCTLFNQNILRILKDSIIVPELGAEITSFAKLYGVTPAAAIFVIIYAKIANYWSFQKIYYWLLVFFLTAFLIFAFLIYPNTETLHWSATKVEGLMQEYPNFKWYIALVSHWGYMLFYILSELWPNIFYGLLFWQLANQLTNIQEAKRFYTLFSLLGNASLILVGIFMMHIASEHSIVQNYFDQADNKILFVQTAIISVVLVGILSALGVRFIFVRFAPSYSLEIPENSLNLKTELGLIESFKYIASSTYLWLLLICSAAFGLSMNLVEVVWRSKIKELYSTVNSYAEASSWYILWTGIVIMIMTIVGNNLMRYYGWFVTAIITPLVILISGTIFFGLVISESMADLLSRYLHLSSGLYLIVLIGAIQNVIAKGTKYSMWDTSREMLYIPLDRELKTKGKAAVDIVSSKLGKSLSSLAQSILFTLFPAATYNSVSLGFMVIFILVCLIWANSISRVSKQYQQFSENNT